ncbi:MAG: secretion protein HlyD [Candidatus Margulisiibacteriota bacterium]|nr:MAG: secretion protein HlyD [Candidatus Margulisiibacteriota bacterium]
MGNLKIFLIIGLMVTIQGCTTNKKLDTYSGQIEATKIKLSSQGTGIIRQFDLEEGDAIVTGQVIARVDTENVAVQRQLQYEKVREAELSLESIESQMQQLQPQIDLNHELLLKTELLVTEGAATVQLRDELATQTKVADAQLRTLITNYNLAKNRIEQANTVIQLTNIQIKNSEVLSPIRGTVVNKYRNAGELVSPGTPLAEIADLEKMNVYIYIPTKTLLTIKIGQTAYVSVDGSPAPIEGTVSWIASEAEFTPKTILTKETRTSLVYEVKIKVHNISGALKIGMPVEVTLTR